MEKSSENSNESEASFFECNICLEQAKDAVVSKCGHLFCWPCLHQWLETRPNIQTCPVCKSSISRDSVTPIYGRNCTDKKDPRDKVPPRPQGQRTEAPRNNVCLFQYKMKLKISFNLNFFLLKELFWFWF